MKELKQPLILAPRTRIFHEDEPKFNAPHHFEIHGTPQGDETSGFLQKIDFQEGPINEVGVNGVTNEDLIACVIARLEGFQNSPFKSDDNQRAIVSLEDALSALGNRTRARLERGVEGTNTV